MLFNRKGELTIGIGVKVLASVVVGAVVLYGAHTVMQETVMPATEQKIVDLFDATPESLDIDITEPETIYDNSIIVNKYARRLFMVNKNLIEEKYSISLAENDVEWFVDGKTRPKTV